MGWSGFYHEAKNHRWSAVDQHVLEVVAEAMGWGPERTLFEIGGGRGLHSRKLWQMGRCGKAMVYDTSAESRLIAERHGMPAKTKLAAADIIWSYGVCEHFDGLERQAIIDRHFEYARELVVIVVPAKTWTMARPRLGVPWRREFTSRELGLRMAYPGWIVTVDSFAPLFTVRHIPDTFYAPLTTLLRRIVPGNLLIGVARREK